MKSIKLWLATILGAQLAFTSLAADGTADTNQDTDIAALKQQLRELTQKVQVLENQRATEQSAATNIANAQIQELDQKVKILARERELDQEAAAAVAKTQPKLTVGPSGLIATSLKNTTSLSLWFCSPNQPTIGRRPRHGSKSNFFSGTGSPSV